MQRPQIVDKALEISMSSRRSAPLTNQKNVDPQRIFMKLSVLEMEKKLRIKHVKTP